MAAALQARNFLLCPSASPPAAAAAPRRMGVGWGGAHNHKKCCSAVKAAMPSVSLEKAPKRMAAVEEYLFVRDHQTRTASGGGSRGDPELPSTSGAAGHVHDPDLRAVTAKLYAVMEAAADRAGMHDAVGAQRDNWNALLLGSVNSITLAASLAAGLSAIPSSELGHLQTAFKASSMLLYSAATAALLVVNKIQPSQLAEEQRNAARLFRQLEKRIQTVLALGRITAGDVEDAVERVLALDRAYPLPLLGGSMLDKFPNAVEPTVWWPKLGHRRRQQQQQPQKRRAADRRDRPNNGWSEGLERVMTGVLRTLKKKDTAEYVREAKLALGVNAVLAAAGPLLTGLAAVGASLVDVAGAGNQVGGGGWPLFLGIVSGSLAVVVNTLEHGGQVGMVFEMYRNCAGFYRQLEEEIEHSLGEEAAGRSREEGELFELEVALRLGRSLPELRDLAAHSCSRDVDIRDHAGKLF